MHGHLVEGDADRSGALPQSVVREEQRLLQLRTDGKWAEIQRLAAGIAPAPLCESAPPVGRGSTRGWVLASSVAVTVVAAAAAMAAAMAGDALDVLGHQDEYGGVLLT